LRVKPRRSPTTGEKSLLFEEGRRICFPARFELEFVDGFEPHPSGKFRPYLSLKDVS
jgi:hypothetical protein